MDESRVASRNCNNIRLAVYSCRRMSIRVDLVTIYQCFCDRTRLRILNLLSSGPLCVCHFQEILGESQVKVSKHLGYLKTHGLVEAQRETNWMIYSLPKAAPRELQVNLACLQDCAASDPVFRKDAERLRKLRAKFEKDSPLCALPSRKGGTRQTCSC